MCPLGTGGSVKIAHVHIPKTAGNTVREAFRRAYPQSRVDRANNRAHMKRMHDGNPPNFDFVQGHMPFALWPVMPGFRWVTVLRDPVERVVSQYNFIMQSGSEVSEPTSVRMRSEGWSFDRFIRSDDEGALVKLFAHTYFLGHGETPEEQACRALDHMDWVATVDRLDDSLEAMGMPAARRENVTRVKAYSPTDAELHYLWGRIRQEHLIYHYGRELEAKRLDRGGMWI